MVVEGSLDIDESIQAGGTGGRAQNFQPLLANLEESANGNGVISNNGNENEAGFNMALQLGIFDDMGAGAASDGDVTAGNSFTLDNGFSPRLQIGVGEESETNMPPLGSVREEDWEAYDNETRRLLEDYKCPICLDTLINTVKVDCSSGHRFCNYCIQCWIRYERQLVTECPVCRGSIYGRTLDLRTDAEVRGIFERLSDRTKRTRLLAVKERLQLEEQQNSYNGYPFYPQDYHHHQQSTPFRFSNGGGGNYQQDFHYQIPLVSARLSNNGRNERSSYLELAFGGYSVSVGDNNEGEVEPAVRPPRQGGQQQQPRSEAALVYPSVWDSFLTPTSATNSNDGSSSRDPFHGNFGAIGDSNEVRYQNYHHQNVEELQSRWNNSLYLSSEESSVNPISNNSSGTVWGGYNYQPVNTSEDSMYAGAIGEIRNSTGLGFTGGGEGSNALVAPPSSPRMNSLGINNQHHFHHPGETAASAHGSLPSPPTSSSRLSHFVPGFVGGSNDHPSLHQQGFTGCGFNNCYTPTCPKHCHFAGPQMPAPVRSNNPVPNHGSCPGMRSANMCYTLPPHSFHPYPASSSSVPASGYFSETAAASVPPTTAPTTTGPVPANDNPATSPRSHIDDAFGRNRQRSCHTQCRAVPPSASQSGGGGVYPVPPGGAAAAAGTGQGSNCRYPSQPDVSSCPTLSNGSFFAGGFPLYSPRSGYIGFHISHHNPPAPAPTDRNAPCPASSPPGRITHPIVSLVPLNPDGSSTRVSLTFEVHSHPHQPQPLPHRP